MNKTEIAFGRLYEIIGRLRAPDGCPWDREQTPETMRSDLVEECFEAVDAINQKDTLHVKEELGDVLLQVVLHSQIASEEGAFNIDDVAKTINEKLIHRHPHVFGNVKVNSTDDILKNWEELKKEEKPHRTSIMDGISKAQSALMSAQKISKKAVNVGFEWPNEETLYECFFSEVEEFKSAKNQDEKEDEFGDILFAAVNIARWNKIDAEQALLRANRKFMARFRKMEELATKELTDYSFEEYDELWKQAKKAIYAEKENV